MKQSIYLTILCLLTGLRAFAQDAIVTMTTTKDLVNIYAEWTGAGSLTANGVELENGHHNIIPAADDGSVILIATGDLQLTHLYCGDNALSAMAAHAKMVISLGRCQAKAAKQHSISPPNYPKGSKVNPSPEQQHNLEQ